LNFSILGTGQSKTSLDIIIFGGLNVV
jgi:hypothetical protein